MKNKAPFTKRINNTNFNKLYLIMKKILLTLAIAGAFTSCKKETPMDDHHSHSHSGPADGTGSLELSTSFLVDGATYSQDSVYVDDFGNNYKISFTSMYLSGFQFNTDGDITPLPTQYLLIKPETSTYPLGTIGAKHYHDFEFNIGLDSTTNHSDPNSYPVSSPLYPQSPSMHWTWASGYIFYKIEGSVDTDNDGVFETNFIFHIGTDGLKRSTSYTIHTDIVKNQTNTLTMKIDLGKFLNGINLSVDNRTHTMNDMPLATRVANNSVTAISK